MRTAADEMPSQDGQLHQPHLPSLLFTDPCNYIFMIYPNVF